MQEMQASLPILQNRYAIEKTLGRGGFSAVYLVRDLLQQDQHFALKELLDHSEQAMGRFMQECALLKRLKHRALPSVEHIFEENDCAYMLMEYIEGPNLEQLYKQQPQQRFTVSEMRKLLEPIVDALIYLHNQPDPIIHRDIKPANIIVSQEEGKVTLVDFGIAKIYVAGSTTTAVRFCTPGYAALEQYGSTKTDQRTDLYGLAATCYVLLTGVVPVDSLQRATCLAAKIPDPLIPVNEYVPSIPSEVTTAIHRALSLNPDERFATVEEFWQAMDNTASKTTVAVAEVLHIAPTIAVTDSGLRGYAGIPSISQPQDIRVPRSRNVFFPIILLILAVGLILTGYETFSFTMGKTSAARSTPLASTPVATTSAPTPETTPPSTSSTIVYPQLASSYAGTKHDLQSQKSVNIQLAHIQQKDAEISGDFISDAETKPLTGTLNPSRHLLFTIPDQAEYSLLFNGTIRPDGAIAGNYCSIDRAGQCVGEYGVWSVTPQS
jgi:serine/threonine protein kinase